MAGGRVAFSGPIDFPHKPDRYDLAMDLDGVDLSALPESWQLHRVGVRGRFTGKAELRLALTPDRAGPDRLDGRRPRRRRRDPRHPAPAARPDAPGSGLREACGDAGAAADRGRSQKGPFLPQWIDADFRVNDVELERALARVEIAGQEGRAARGPGLGPAGAAARRPVPARGARRPEGVHGAWLGRRGGRDDRRPGPRPVDGAARPGRGQPGGRRPARPDGRTARRRRPARADRAAPGRGPPAPRRLPRQGPRRARRRAEPPASRWKASSCRSPS